MCSMDCFTCISLWNRGKLLTVHQLSIPQIQGLYRESNKVKSIYNVSYHVMIFTISFTQVSNKIPAFQADSPSKKKGVFDTNFIKF